MLWVCDSLLHVCVCVYQPPPVASPDWWTVWHPNSNEGDDDWVCEQVKRGEHYNREGSLVVLCVIARDTPIHPPAARVGDAAGGALCHGQG